MPRTPKTADSRDWEPVGVEGSISERIVRRIEEVITSDDLQPGDRLPSERVLAASLNVSRASVREALRVLSAKGRIQIEHGRGVFIAPSRLRQDLREAMAKEVAGVHELYAMREVLEAPAARWAAENADEAEVERLKEILALCDDLPESALDEYRQLDAKLHRAIVEIAGNRFLQQTLGVLEEMIAQGQPATITVAGRVRISRIEHGAVVDAIAAADSDAAEAAMRTHLRNTRTRSVDRVEAAHSD